MTKKTNQDEMELPEENCEKTSDDRETADWANDQTRRSYYYDDSFGYEKYDPDDEEE